MQIKVTRVDNALYVHPAPPYLTNYLKYTRRSMEMEKWKKVNVFTKYDLHRVTSDGGLVTYRGFFQQIEHLVKKNGDELTVIDQRTPLPEIDRDAVLNIKYRDHQVDLLVEYFDNLQKNDGVFWATGGAGKTYMQAATYAAYNKLNTILAIPLKAVVLQTYNKFKELFPNKHIGLVADGVVDVSDDITICTLASLDRCSLEKCKLFMCDEIQGATSDRMQNLITSVNAIRNIGFTATDKNFFSKSEKVLTALFGDRLCEMDYKDAEEANAVVPGVVYFMETSDMPRHYSDVDNKMKYGVKLNDERNRSIGVIAAAVPADWQCLAFIDHVTDHLPALYKHMPSGTRYVHRESSKKKAGNFALSNKQQKDTIQDFMDNKFKNMIATDAFRAGVSVDNIRCVIQCAGGCSEVEILQEAYRGSRIMTPDVQEKLGVSPKTHFVLVDFLDGHDEALAAMSKARRKIYAEQGWEIRDIKSVDEIDWHYYPGKTCPASTELQTSKQENHM